MADETTVIDYATKYSEVIDERFKIASVTDSAVNRNYNFDGVKTIHIYSVETAELNDYDRTKASNRYGTPKELGLAAQAHELTQDKSFTFTIDAGNYNDTVLASSAGNALQREIDEVITPTIDKYRIAKLVENAGTTLTADQFAMETAYVDFLHAGSILTENIVPTIGRIAFVTPTFCLALKYDKRFTGTGDKANEIAVTGSIMEVDKTAIVVVPTSYFPDEDIMFIITHPCAMISPVKLAEYKIHNEPQGISGWLCEGRVYYDAFVLKNKKKAVIVKKYSSSDTNDD